MSAQWTLRDMDNRDPDGAPWEMTESPTSLAEYVDGPVRKDLSASTDEEDLDALVKAFREGDITAVQSLGPTFSIYVSEAP